ncbi:MAG: hypothetical protein Q7J48_20010 [Nocardioides sp.]|nr:hypothetical protein [Nocardioides sp.]
MAVLGGFRARTCALALLAALLSPVLLAGCSEDVDQAHAVQTRLGRMEQVDSTKVTSPTADRGARIALVVQDGLSAPEIVALADAVAGIAADEGYLAYRLTLRVSGTPAAALVVDDDFGEDPRAAAVVGHWQRLSSALLGETTYRYQPGVEIIEVETAGGLVHDVQEAGRIGYGSTATSWRFAAGGSVFVDDGRLHPQDVLLVQRVERTVASPSLPVPAPAWRLETRADHVLLDLPVVLPQDGVTSSMLTVAAFEQPLRSLALGAIDALSVTGKPVWLRLHHRSGDGDDVFAWWASDVRPLPGRDPLHRGWDAWLATLAGA